MADGEVSIPGRAQRVRFSFESLGWRRALQELVTWRRPCSLPEHDHSFDARHGTDTAGSVEAERLGIGDDVRRGQAIRYLPSPEPVTNWMLDRLAVDPATHAFVDLGCGKGRVLLLAAQRPFHQVVGVEISAELAAIARRNAATYRPPPVPRSGIEVVEADVTTFDLPPSNLVLHLYHPFEPEVTATVLRRLESSLATSPRQVTLAYLAYTSAIGPVTEMLSGFEWLRRDRYEQSVRGHYNWLFYRN